MAVNYLTLKFAFREVVMRSEGTNLLEKRIAELLMRISSVRAEIMELKNQKRLLSKLARIKKARDKDGQ